MAKQLYSITVNDELDFGCHFYSVFIAKVHPNHYSMTDGWDIDRVLSDMRGYKVNGFVTDIDGVLDFVDDCSLASRKVVARNLRERGEFYATRFC